MNESNFQTGDVIRSYKEHLYVVGSINESEVELIEIDSNFNYVEKLHLVRRFLSFVKGKIQYSLCMYYSDNVVGVFEDDDFKFTFLGKGVLV